MEKAYLCREALVSLGIIAKDFSKATAMTSPDVTASMDSCEEYTCSCPRRQHELQMPTSLPNRRQCRATERMVTGLLWFENV